MNHQFSFECTSADFEKAAIHRFRSLVSFLPLTCKVFREPWECSTVLCLDFADCPSYLELAKQEARSLAEAAETLGLAGAIVFRVSHKFMGRVANISLT
jgi:hypothetical protein